MLAHFYFAGRLRARRPEFSIIQQVRIFVKRKIQVIINKKNPAILCILPIVFYGGYGIIIIVKGEGQRTS